MVSILLFLSINETTFLGRTELSAATECDVILCILSVARELSEKLKIDREDSRYTIEQHQLGFQQQKLTSTFCKAGKELHLTRSCLSFDSICTGSCMVSILLLPRSTRGVLYCNIYNCCWSQEKMPRERRRIIRNSFQEKKN